MAERVLDATIDLPTFVACDDDEVASWASARGAKVLWGPGLGLNGAIDQGVATIGDLGFDRVTIAHGDLPLPAGITAVDRAARLLGGGKGGVVLVPDRRRDGTNVQSRPSSADLPASYGAASFSAHLAQSLASGLPVAVRFDERLSLDIDTIDDCRHPLVASLLEPMLSTGALA
jgi:2-phospho-L-lactate guanylyltransferase